MKRVILITLLVAGSLLLMEYGMKRMVIALIQEGEYNTFQHR